MNSILTVGKLRSFLEQENFESEITFGSSKYGKRPLVFYRFKKKGDNLLLIELNEIDECFDAISEIDCRVTVGSFLKQLELWDEHYEVTFGGTIDGKGLFYREMKSIVAINLEQI